MQRIQLPDIHQFKVSLIITHNRQLATLSKIEVYNREFAWVIRHQGEEARIERMDATEGK